MPADLYTGNWIFEKDLEGNLSTEHLTLTPTNFFHEYDGSKTGTMCGKKRKHNQLQFDMRMSMGIHCQLRQF